MTNEIKALVMTGVTGCIPAIILFFIITYPGYALFGVVAIGFLASWFFMAWLCWIALREVFALWSAYFDGQSTITRVPRAWHWPEKM